MATLRLEVRRAVAAVGQTGETVIAVLAADHPRNQAAAGMLDALPQVGVLAQLDACDDATLVSALQLGVDAWCPRNCSPNVLALAVHNLRRRLETSSESSGSAQARAQLPERCAGFASRTLSSGRWLLRDQAWRLQTPAGQTIQLTTSERTFMLKLINGADRSAPHAELLQGSGRLADHASAKIRLGVLVSRLRRKVAAHGTELPIKSLHSWGYMFTDHIAVHD